MKVPLTWLKEILPTKLTADEIADLLTLIGLEVEGTIQKDTEEILEISLTPNLAHCLSIKGVARELAAVTQEKLKADSFPSIQTNEKPVHEIAKVTVENSEACPRYMCRVIENVKVGLSPAWLREKLENAGFRSVNNIVDCTNYVLMELGHPLHAFDFDKISEGHIVVRNAAKGEKIVTLDEKEHFPPEETLLICDAKRPVAIAGVMGSKESEVSESTARILLECAYFEPKAIRRAGKRLEIQTDASYRFERGCDPNGLDEALEKATSLICELSGGIAFKGKIDVKAKEFLPALISCRLLRLNRLLGTQLAMGEVETLFRRLGFAVHEIKGDTISLKVPTYRQDVHQEIDLIEEVARLYGFDNIHKKEQPYFRLGKLSHSESYTFEKEIRTLLLSEGLQEFLTCNLISPADASFIEKDLIPSRSLIKILNPGSEDQSVMRPSLLPGLLKVVKFNADHEVPTIAGFEVGRVHFKLKDRFLEPSVLGIVLSGKKGPLFWDGKTENVDFFDLKGVIENLFLALKIKARFSKSAFSNFHPGRQAQIFVDEAEVGTLGEIHPQTLKKAGLKEPVYYAELNLNDLKNFAKLEQKMSPLPQFPSSTRDLTLTLKQECPVQKVFDILDSFECRLLEAYYLLGVFASEKLGKDKKNITVRFVYRDLNKTLSQTDVEKEHARLTLIINEKIKEDLT